MLPADGFYEWAPARPRKQPYRAAMHNGEIFGLAGLWARWRPRDGGDPVETCTIITTDANALLAPIHERMPVIVAPEDYARWLDPAVRDPADVLKPFAAEAMLVHPVSRRVSDARNDDAGLIEPAPAE